MQSPTQLIMSNLVCNNTNGNNDNNNNNNFNVSNNNTNYNLIRGRLTKFTNSLRGFRSRYFILDPSKGTLEYYLKHDTKRKQPRRLIVISGSTVTPCDEDGQSFTLCTSAGKKFLLRASDSKQRQFWVDKLRQVSQNHDLICNNYEPLEISTLNSLEEVRNIVLRAKKELQQLEDSIDIHTKGDLSFLQTKAIGQASVSAMKQCYTILNASSKT